ncbi:hypothetical protein FDR95_04165 [Rhizobiaceae bacterium LC148]|nr:hypothetical protein FDR95_04165 [Rhizobiaceae bacterium LC148]
MKRSLPHARTRSEAIANLESAVEFIQRDIAELKTDLKEMRGDISSIRTTDLRILFRAMISVAFELGALMVKGFGWI